MSTSNEGTIDIGTIARCNMAEQIHKGLEQDQGI